MRFLNWLSATATGLLSLYYKHRGKAYVRLSLMLVGIGGGIFALKVFAELVLQTTIKQLLGPAADVPWWIAIGLIGTGVIIFIAFAIFDPDVFRSTKNEGAISLAIPSNWTFEQAARVIGQTDQKPVDLNELTIVERGAILSAHQVRAANASEALKQLRALAPPGLLREYNVIVEDNQLVLRPI